MRGTANTIGLVRVAGAVVALAAGVLLLRAVLLRTERHSAAGVRVLFPSNGVVRAEGLAGAGVADLRAGDGTLVSRRLLYGRDAAEFYHRWEPGAGYVIHTDGVPTATARAPAAPEVARVRIRAPLGRHSAEYSLTDPADLPPILRIPMALGEEETVDVLIEVEKQADGGELTVTAAGADPDTEAGRLHEGTLVSEFDCFSDFRRLKRTDFSGGSFLFTVSVRDHASAAPGFTIPITFEAVSATSPAERIRVSAISMPTDARGRTDVRREPGVLALPGGASVFAARVFGLRLPVPDFYRPFAYQTLTLENRSELPAGVILSSRVSLPEGTDPLPFFSAPQPDPAGAPGEVVAYYRLPADSVTRCSLPVYVRPDTPSGTYRRLIHVRLLGSDMPVSRHDAPLIVRRGRPLFTAWLVVTVAVTAAWLAGFALFYPRLVSSFGVRILVLLALLGALQFCLSFAGGLVSNILYAVLGPFNCLVGGLLTEVLTYVILTAVLVIVPRVGAVSLSGVITYLIGGVLFGSFGITDILFVGSMIAWREAVLAGFGVTSVRPRERPFPLIRAMLALGLADAIAAFTSLTLQAVFYRLFFAPWYIVLQVVVTGFAYTAIGVAVGYRLGRDLRKVHA